MSDEQLKPPFVFVIFGITGDLAQRKILPALYHLVERGALSEQVHIIGVSRREVSLDDVYSSLPNFVDRSGYDNATETWLKDRTEMRQMDLDNRSDYETLLAHLKEIEGNLKVEVARMYYLSVPAQAFQPIIALLGETGHAQTVAGSNNLPRLLIEKPFGYDLTSAQELVGTLKEHFSEAQVYRIDHYVAKQMVQHIMTFRLHNPGFNAIWNNQYISHIEVSAHEAIDIEGRADFYEQTGALRDFLQGHLMQVLAITIMDQPNPLSSDALHSNKLRELQALQPAAISDALRGQYDGYRQEVNNAESTTETFAALTLHSDSESWHGVTMTLETGKALHEKLAEVVVYFTAESEGSEQDRLVFCIQPEETIELHIHSERLKAALGDAPIDLTYARSNKSPSPDAYEQVVTDALQGNQMLFTTSAEVLRSWEIVEPVLEAWQHNAAGLKFYGKGSSGPVES